MQSTGRDSGWQKVMDALDEHFVRLMRNWARVAIGSSEAFASTGAYDGISTDAWGDGGMPLLTGEAADVDLALQSIDQRYRKAVTLFWTREGESLPRLAVRLRPGMHYETAQAWVMKGHELLRAELHRRREVARMVRMRNEAVTQTA
jgi:hypothetical protein